MPTLAQRVDLASITVRFLPLPKGKKRGSGVGFCGGDPVAAIDGAGPPPPVRWVNGKPEPITFQDIKKLNLRGTSQAQIAGFWTTPKGDERALVWTRSADGTLTGVELHPSTWQKSSALACGDGQQIGFGYEKFVRDPSRALLWDGTRQGMVVLTGPDASRESMGLGVARGVQVGYIGGSGRQRACLWRGTNETYVDLHPESTHVVASEALGTDGEFQVGHIWDTQMASRAALWSGASDSYVNLAPDGFLQSRARRCARGMQVGWVCRQDRGMLIRAVLWHGSADEYVDLQNALPEPWNASEASDLEVDGDVLRIIGSAQQAVTSGKYEMDAGRVPVVWEMRLLIAEPRAPRDSAPRDMPAIVTPPRVSEAEPSAEQRIDKAAGDFARAVIDGDYEAAYALLAPWLQDQVTPKKLQTILAAQYIDGIEPADFDVTGNDSTLDELREHYAEYHANDESRTLATVEEFGEWGPPSIWIADAITPESFRQWMAIEFTPADDDESGPDYCLRLWLIVVDVGGAMRIGHLEPGD